MDAKPIDRWKRVVLHPDMAARVLADVPDGRRTPYAHLAGVAVTENPYMPAHRAACLDGDGELIGILDFETGDEHWFDSIVDTRGEG